ncbi:hybrid sensor histidine kinase/response regulator [Lysobacter humi (ex Lee et al. 2017)]
MSPPEDPTRGESDALYEDAPCGLLMTGRDGTILRANRTFCRWVQVEPDALVGRRRFQDLLTVGGKIFHQTHFAPLLQMQGSVSEVKLDLARPDGPPLPIVLNAVRHPRDDGWEDAIAVFVAQDRHAYERELMLARKRAEELAARQLEAQEQLRRADRRKDEFLAMLAHELRNPLAPISTAAHLLASATEQAQLQRIADIIGRQASHLTHLVDDLLDVSRVTRGLIQLERETLDLADAVEAAVEQTRPLVVARAHALQVRVPRGTYVDGDRTRLVQVLANLLNNAAKYTPQGGRIEVDLEVDGPHAVVTVRDDGLGIDAALLPHIFDLFSQAERTPDRSQGGLGLGLALVKSLVALHGGDVAVHSDGLHQGSRFSVRLPHTVQAPQASGVPVSPAVVAPRPLRVLVVDDNADALEMLVAVLDIAGHATRSAATAEGALRIADASIDVCVLDIGLPDISGYELATRLRERVPRAVLVALTGYGQAHDRVLSKAAGFEHHLVKPVDIERLLALLASIAVDVQARAPA